MQSRARRRTVQEMSRSSYTAPTWSRSKARATAYGSLGESGGPWPRSPLRSPSVLLSNAKSAPKAAPVIFERQRLLLRLLDALGGAAGSLDFQKPLFLYCQESGSTGAYEFVPVLRDTQRDLGANASRRHRCAQTNRGSAYRGEASDDFYDRLRGTNPRELSQRTPALGGTRFPSPSSSPPRSSASSGSRRLVSGRRTSSEKCAN
jgi:hypothetical protein